MIATKSSKTALLFAGQGSQYAGMGDGYGFPYLEKRVIDAMKTGEGLNETINTQPAIFAVGLEMAKKLNIKPDYVAGFSVGEIPALVYAGVLSLDDGVKLINVRANTMQDACNDVGGVMVAVVKIDAQEIAEKCGVYAANFNAPGQIVYAGSTENINKFSEQVKAAGGRAIPLNTSGAFHSPLMDDAQRQVEIFLQKIYVKQSHIPVYSNLTGKLFTDKLEISDQINNPVRWQSIIENMLDNGVRTFYEVGPGKVLTGLVKKIAEHRGIDISFGSE